MRPTAAAAVYASTIGLAARSSWLFPGQRPGQHVSSDRLGQRLIALGIQPSTTRSTALFTLATELPAAILARMLDIHIKVAVQWQQAASCDCAADISRRSQDADPDSGTDRK